MKLVAVGQVSVRNYVGYCFKPWWASFMMTSNMAPKRWIKHFWFDLLSIVPTPHIHPSAAFLCYNLSSLSTHTMPLPFLLPSHSLSMMAMWRYFIITCSMSVAAAATYQFILYTSSSDYHEIGLSRSYPNSSTTD